ncbi:MAG TPA: rhomboid family intramembrane serine protease [Candidatus Eisenbacteria bacterium]
MRKFPVTYYLLASIAVVFAIELSMGAMGNDESLARSGALRDAGVLNGEYWRLLTYAWLHAGWNHFLLNVALLWWVGRIVERRLGSVATLGTYLFAVFGGGIGIAVRAALHPKAGTSLGASAGVFALLACAIILLFRPDTARFGQPAAARIALVIIAVAGLAASLLPGVSLVGHVTGLTVGAIAGTFLRPVRDSTVPAATARQGVE